MMKLTQEVLKELLHYDPDTGVFTWLERDRKWFKNDAQFKNWNGRYPNQVAGCIDKGYVRITLLWKHYNAHRLAWLYVTGELPKYEILHNDQDGTNNRFSNLSDDTHAENTKNRKRNHNNKSGFTGICWYKALHKWCAQISVNSKVIHLGYFEELDDAMGARKKANTKYGFHENHGAHHGG